MTTQTTQTSRPQAFFYSLKSCIRKVIQCFFLNLILNTRTDKKFPKWCYNCGRSVAVKLLPCSRCKKVFYCSNNCKQKGWNDLHKNECVLADSRKLNISIHHIHIIYIYIYAVDFLNFNSIKSYTLVFVSHFQKIYYFKNLFFVVYIYQKQIQSSFLLLL